VALAFPAACNTPRRRVEFCIHAEEKLRQLHNKMGRWYRVTLDPVENPPITQAQYDASFPSGIFDKIKARYPYAPALTHEQWDDFQDNVWTKLQNKLSQAQSAEVELLRASSEFTPDLEDLHGDL